MIRYKSSQQLSLDGFETPFEQSMLEENRWVKLSRILPWDKFASVYYKAMDSENGAPCKDARVVIGSLIIKHKLKLDDRGTIEMIQENPYMQYFLGFKGFKSEPIFDASLFVTIRKRIGLAVFEELTSKLLIHVAKVEEASKETSKTVMKKKGKASQKKNNASGTIVTEAPTEEEAPVIVVEVPTEEEAPVIVVEAPKEEEAPETVAEAPKEENRSFILTNAGDYEEKNIELASEEVNREEPANQGILKVDATVCDQYIKYPTDIELVGKSRLEAERLIDILWKELKIKVKPKTYREKAQQDYLSAVKSKKPKQRKRRTAIGKQLRYLRRDLKHIDTLLDTVKSIPFKKRDYKIMLVIREIYRQQWEMWKEKKNRCDDRIVSISQPHVRPIVRGKSGKNVEFGSKISISLVDGFTRVDKLSWDAFHEGTILQDQVESYRSFYGYYPEKVAADQIYGSRENRNYLKSKGIDFQVKPLGRPPKDAKKTNKKERVTRNDLEGKFGEGKNGYRLNQIRAKLKETSESWVGAIFFTMNVNEWFRRAGAMILFFLIQFYGLIAHFYAQFALVCLDKGSVRRDKTCIQYLL